MRMRKPVPCNASCPAEEEGRPIHSGPGSVLRTGLGPLRNQQGVRGRPPMGWRDRFGLRKANRKSKARFDRDSEDSDMKALMEFAKSRVGVEFFVEPETFATQTTAVAVATDGEWTRRRCGSPESIRKLAKKLALPAYDVQIVGYPQRMRDWNAQNKGDRSL